MSPTTAQTPLLSPEKEGPRITDVANNEHDVQFYDPAAILDVSREVAFGYLILLTGGNVSYEPPTLEEVSAVQTQDDSTQQPTSGKAEESQDMQSTPALDEESAALAYAAIVDGNILHACFGLKAAANGRASPVPIIGEKYDGTSAFCCFPTSSAAMQLMLPNAAKNKLRLQNLVEVLREVGDLHHERLAVGGAGDCDKDQLHARIFQAYSRCFASVVRYHDSKKHIQKGTKGKSAEKSKQDGIIGCCSQILGRLNPFSKAKVDPRLERLQNGALGDIEGGFRGLKEEIWECLERTATETAFTGVSVETSSPRRGGKR